MSNSWRERAAPIIAKVISDVGRADMKVLKAALRAAYPFGPRQYHPYKIWCSEVRAQLYGRKFRKGRSVPKDLVSGDLFA